MFLVVALSKWLILFQMGSCVSRHPFWLCNIKANKMHWKSYIFFPLLATFGSRILLREYACSWESCWDNRERCITLSQIEVPHPQGDKRVCHHTTGREYQQPASPKSALLEHERTRALERKEVNIRDRSTDMCKHIHKKLLLG